MNTLTIVLLTACAVAVYGAYVPDYVPDSLAKQSNWDQTDNQDQQEQQIKKNDWLQKQFKLKRNKQQSVYAQDDQDKDVSNADALLAFFDNVKMDVRTVDDLKNGVDNKTSRRVVFRPYPIPSTEPLYSSENVVLYVHGENETNPEEREQQFVKAYASAKMNLTFIGVDYSKVHPKAYEPFIVYSFSYVAGKLREQLESSELSGKTVQLIGYSMGAHIAGYAARNSKVSVQRITGLDPTGAGFSFGLYKNNSLSRDDAKIVDVIHTNYDNYGMSRSVGQYDFYPDGGIEQHRCRLGNQNGVIGTNNTCNHKVSVDYYVESINCPSNGLKARKCASYLMYVIGQCNEDNASYNYMGHCLHLTANANNKGSYFIRTIRPIYEPSSENHPHGIRKQYQLKQLLNSPRSQQDQQLEINNEK